MNVPPDQFPPSPPSEREDGEDQVAVTIDQTQLQTQVSQLWREKLREYHHTKSGRTVADLESEFIGSRFQDAAGHSVNSRGARKIVQFGKRYFDPELQDKYDEEFRLARDDETQPFRSQMELARSVLAKISGMDRPGTLMTNSGVSTARVSSVHESTRSGRGDQGGSMELSKDLAHTGISQDKKTTRSEGSTGDDFPGLAVDGDLSNAR